MSSEGNEMAEKRSRTEYMRQYKRELRAKLKSVGVCIECGSPLAERSTTLCQKHLELQKLATARWKEKGKKNAVHDRDQ